MPASKWAYRKIIYVRFCNFGRKFHSNLVTSKTKIAPVLGITLASLELLATLIGARLFHHIGFYLNLTKGMTTSFWSNYMMFLRWVKNNSRKLKILAENRVAGIKEISDPDCWNHCPSRKLKSYWCIITRWKYNQCKAARILMVSATMAKKAQKLMSTIQRSYRSGDWFRR